MRITSRWPLRSFFARHHRARPVAVLLAVTTLAGVSATLLSGEAAGRAETDRDDQRSAAATATTETPAPPPETAPPTTTTTTVPVTTTTTTRPLPTGVLIGPWRQAAPGVDVSVFQPSPGGAGVGVAIFNQASVRFSWSPSGSVPAPYRPALLAAFNGGFKFPASEGGWFLNGQTGAPLRNGAASFVVYANGTATVGQWGRDVTMGPAVAEVRQNLTLLIDHGALTTAASSQWGATITHTPFTSRSAVGIDGAGRLIYAGGPGLDPSGLARVLLAAGAVRAMQFDINPEWVSLELFGNGSFGSRLVASMAAPAFLTGDRRDFVAVFAR